MEPSASGAICLPFREDYFECLHHKKEYDMIKRINDQEKLNAEKAAGGGGDGHGH